MNILAALRDPNLFGAAFAPLTTWDTWRVALAAAYGEPLDRDDLRAFREIAGARTPPPSRVRELWAVVGRRGGKSRIAAAIAVHAALFGEHRVAPGETPVVMLLAADRRQARVLLGYVRALIHGSPLLEREVARELRESVDLRNGARIEVHTSNFRSIRGYTVVCAICDELAFWPADETSVNPDAEVLAALRPALATCNGMLVCISSPYAKRGELYSAYRKHYGQPVEDILVVQGSSRQFNPMLSEQLVARELERDEARARSEYLAEFRSDIEGFISREAVEACVIPGRLELPLVPGTTYRAFVDPSGGSSDSMTLAIAHRDGETVVIDALREAKPPFSPDQVVEDFVRVLKSYGIPRVTGDQYGGEWPRERFRVHGIEYDLASKTRSDLYRDLLPAINAQRIELLDHDRCVNQLVSLERRTSRGGRDSIDHAPGAHDDVANAVAGIVDLTDRKHPPLELFEIGPSHPGWTDADYGPGWTTFRAPRPRW